MQAVPPPPQLQPPPIPQAPPSAQTSTMESVPAVAAQNHLLTDGIVNKTLYKCRKCKLLFWTTKKAGEHEQLCNGTQHIYIITCVSCNIMNT